MDFGTFYRMRQLRERAMDADDMNMTMANDGVSQSENFSQLPVHSTAFSNFDNPAHPQLDFTRDYEGDRAMFYENNGRGRDFHNDQSWEFHEERGFSEDFDGMTGQGGRGKPRGSGRGRRPSGRWREAGSRLGRGRPSERGGRGQPFQRDSWADHVDDTGPWHHEGGDAPGEERRDCVEQNERSDWNAMEHEAEVRSPMISKRLPYPADHGNIGYGQEASSEISKKMHANDLPGTSSDGSTQNPAKTVEKQTMIDQKQDLKEDEKMVDHDGQNKSSQETSDQKRKNMLGDTVSTDRVEGKTQEKQQGENVGGGVEDMALTQLQDPTRTVFNCCYCSVSSTSIEEFRDHVKGNFHRENFASLIEGKKSRQEKTSSMAFKRHELGRHSFLAMDLDTFQKEHIIGLSYVTEVQSIFGIKCICHLCGIMFSNIGGQAHVTSFKHRMRYLRDKWPEDYDYILQFPERRSGIDVLHRILQKVEQRDGRGTPAIFVFEGKASSDGELAGSSDDPGALNFHHAFGAFVNQELQVAKQKIVDDPLPFDYDTEGGATFTDNSDYVQIWDLETENAAFFDENIASDRGMSSDAGWKFPDEGGFADGAVKTRGHERMHQSTGAGRGAGPERSGMALVADYEDTHSDGDAADTSYNSSKLVMKGVSGPSSKVAKPCLVSKDKQEEKKGTEIKSMAKENTGEQKNDNLTGSDAAKMAMLEAEDEVQDIEQKEKGKEKLKAMTFQRDELGKTSFLLMHLNKTAKEAIIGLSFVTEYQHTSGFQCICQLCGSQMFYRTAESHLISLKHRLRYLREKKPEIYVNLRNLPKPETTNRMRHIVQQVETTDGRGSPVIRVFDYKKGSTNDDLTSDNQNQDDIDPEEEEKEIQEGISQFKKFVTEEFITAKNRPRKPFWFEPNFKEEGAPPDHNDVPQGNVRPPFPRPLEPRPLFERPIFPPDPRFQRRPMKPEPFLREHDPYYMRMRPDPYVDPVPFERARRARLYPDESVPFDPLERAKRDETFLDPDPFKRMRRDEPYLDPDPLKRIRRNDPYVDPNPVERGIRDERYIAQDPWTRMRRNEPSLDPDPLKRRAFRGSYPYPDPSKRLKFDEPYIDPDPLKRVLPSQKAAKKPVVIDYGHGSEEKSAKNKADQWEQDIKDILNESKGPDSLAQLSCSYSSPKKEDTPPPSRPKRQLPFSRSYMEKSKELKKLDSSKKERNKDSQEKEEFSRRLKSSSPSRKHRRSRSPLYGRGESRANLKDSVRRGRTKSSSRRNRHSRSPESKESSSKRYKRSRSPEDYRTKRISKDKDRRSVKRSSRSPDKERMTSFTRGKDSGISPLRKSSSNRPENFISEQKGSRQRDVFIDLTSDEEKSLSTREKSPPAHTNIEKSSRKKEPEPDTNADVDEAQADLIAEMLLTMKGSIIGKDADPETALKAILSQDITKVLLATKDLTEKGSPPKVKEARRDEKRQDSLDRYLEEKAGPSEMRSSSKSKVKQTEPQREKIAFSFAGRSRPTSNLASQIALCFPEDDDDDDLDDLLT